MCQICRYGSYVMTYVLILVWSSVVQIPRGSELQVTARYVHVG